MDEVMRLRGRLMSVQASLRLERRETAALRQRLAAIHTLLMAERAAVKRWERAHANALTMALWPGRAGGAGEGKP